ncbi:MAG: UDP-N-acetylmuramate--L-alanine ligase [Actinomycetes bacterium]
MINLADLNLKKLAGLNIHFIGIGGAGMSGIARIMLAKSIEVSGSDKNESQMTLALKALGAKVQIGHDAKNIDSADLVVVSAAISKNNPEYAAAVAAGLPIAARATALSWLLSDSKSVAVAGTHGKTTTTAMLTVALQAAGVDPSFAIGGTINSAGTNAHSGSGDIFVVEADESDGSFLAYQPLGAIITNIELDHVDHFTSEEQLFKTFADFVGSIKPDGFLVVCGDDSGVKKLIKMNANPNIKVITYGQGPDNDYQISRINLAAQSSTAQVTINGRKAGELSLVVPGLHNLLNALAAFAAGCALQVNELKLIQGLGNFSGTKRRFELKGEVNGVKVIDDYGHHPTEIEVTLTAAKNLAGSGRVLTVFQPHRYSRTSAFTKEFARSLSLSDFVYLLEIYAASEKPMEGVSSLLISKLMSAEKVKFEPSMLQVVADVAKAAKSGDVIITLGAGDVSSLSAPILDALMANELDA